LLEENRILGHRISELSSSAQKVADWFEQEVQCEFNNTSYPKETVSWRRLAVIIAPQIVQNAEEEYVFRSIARELLGLKYEYNLQLSEKSEDDIRMKFVINGIAGVFSEQREGYSVKVWLITEYGKSQLSLMMG
jgi:hypothetical protein